MDQAQRVSRIVYPELPEILTEDDLVRLFTVTPQEEQWATTVARRGPSMVALLMHLKVFQHVGRFLPVAEVPSAAIARVAQQLSQGVPAAFAYDRRTLYRHDRAI